MQHRMLLVMVTIIIFIVIASFFIPKEIDPSPETRIILEHNKKTYIAPTCFEESNATNFIQDATLEQAQDLEYAAHSSCTEEALKSEKDSLFIGLLKEIGIVDKKWDNW